MGLRPVMTVQRTLAAWRGGLRVLVSFGVWSAATSAQQAPGLEEPALTSDPIDVHGFVSQGFILTSKNEYLAHSKRGSVEFSEVGLNLTKSLTEDLRLGVQFFAHELGPIGNFDPQVDWFSRGESKSRHGAKRCRSDERRTGLANPVSSMRRDAWSSGSAGALCPSSLFPARSAYQPSLTWRSAVS